MSGTTSGLGPDAEREVATSATEASVRAATGTLEATKLTYQVILRHLAKFRDVATAVQDLLAHHECEVEVFDSSEPAEGVGGDGHQQTPLQRRIQRHLGSVDRALAQLRSLSSERRNKSELPPEIRRRLAIKERTIHDIVGAELHFWAAAIENAPLDRFDETEQAWVRRMIHLANILGVDAEHREHLEFLEEWAAQPHS